MPRKANNAAETASVKKERKAYPDRDTRIAMAEEKIAQLEKLNAERRELIAKTEAKLNARKAALANTEEQLAKAVARRDKLIAAKNRPAAGSRAVKTAEKNQIEMLKAKLAAQGKTLEELLNSL